MAGDHLEFDGLVTETRASGNFLVKLADTDREVNATLCGKMRKNKIRVLLGDTVRVRFSPYDLDRAQIIYRAR